MITSDRLKNNQSLSDLIAEITTNLERIPTTGNTIYDRLNPIQSMLCSQPNTAKCPSPSFSPENIQTIARGLTTSALLPLLQIKGFVSE